MAIYMKYGSIKGPVETKGFEGWIELTSFKWGAGRHVGSAARGSTLRDKTEARLSEVTVKKNTDASSTKLFHESVIGDLKNKVTIKFTDAANPPETYMTYELSGCGVSNYSIESGGDKPIEDLTLNFTKISKTHVTNGTPDTVGFDLTTMTKT